jgi:ornithine cyclodeaminase
MPVSVLDSAAVRSLAPMPEVIDSVRQALLDAHAGILCQPPRHSFGGGTGLVMPVFHTRTGSTVVKSLSLNADRQPTIVGSVSWTEPDSADVLVADAQAVTALRTGAIVGVATDLLADDDAHRLLLFGAGAQAADQVRAVACVRTLSAVTVVAPHRAKAEKFARVLATELPDVQFRTSDCTSPLPVDVDIVCCATPSTTPLFEAAALPERVHVNAIGSYTAAMRELPLALLAAATTLIVDDREACLAEAGELIDAVDGGIVSPDRLLTLAEALLSSPPRTGRSVFKSVGIAAQDWAVMRVLSDRTATLRTPSVPGAAGV